MGKDRLPSKPNIFLLLVFILPGNTFPTTEPQYMVLLPFLIHTDSSEKVCVQLTHLNESVTLSAILEYQGENRSLIDDVMSEKDVFTCIPFSLPKSNSTSVAFLTVVVKGATLRFRSRKSVLVKNSESLVFVQTDKPIYKPGQTVLFRIVSLDKDFYPLNEKFPFVYVQDPQRNRVYQWQGVELETGLTQLSFPLTSDPIQGSYKIVVQKSFSYHVEHSFRVKEYVLPKYEVLVKLPKMITIKEKELPVSVCGLYTYGKPVPGLVNVQVCRKFSHSASNCYGKEAEAVCEEFTRQADTRGCVSGVVRTKIFQLQRRGYEMSIEVQGKITEDGTGTEMTGTGSCGITPIMSKISFDLLDSQYRPGIPLFGRVKLVDGTDAPIANETITISVDGDKYKGNYTTDEQGQSWFSIDTTTFTQASLEIRADHKPELNCYDNNWITPSYEHAMRRISRFYSPSKSFLKIEPKPETLSCGSPTEIHVHYIFTPEAIGEQKKIVIYYLYRQLQEGFSVTQVMAKGGIVLADTYDLSVNPGDGYGTFQLTFPIEASVAPLAQMLVYTTSPSGEVIASSADFQVEHCLPNKVRLSFVPKEGLPASNTRLQLHTSSRSLCALRAVDKSVLLMKPEDELSPSSVYDLLPLKEMRGYSFKDYYLEEDNVNPCVSLDNMLLNGFVYVPISPDGEGDAYDILKVSVSLAESTHFVTTPEEKQEESYCICMNERKTVAWAVTPRSLGQVEFSVGTEALQNQQPCGNAIVETPEKGRKDTVIRQLLVEPEGTEVETTYNSVLCAFEKSVSEPILLVLPETVVDGSARACFSVIAANEKENHVYTKALMAYTFALAGKEEKRKALLSSLEKEAVKKVEMTAYVLLAHLTTQPTPSQEELSFTSLIAKWITGQQNPNGGFSSTQDTVVALQALSLYGAVTYAKSGAASKVTLRSGGDFQQDFQVDPTNRLLLQRVPLPQVPGEYSMEVSGDGCVYLQTSLRYNVQPTQEDAPFMLHVYTMPETCVDSNAHKVFDIGINVSYTGERNVSNMVIVDVKMLSGFIPIKSSVTKLERDPVIERTELSTNHVLVYLEKLGSETLSFSFTVERDVPVQGLKPAQVKVYDYYETDEFATQEYSAPCTTGSLDDQLMLHEIEPVMCPIDTPSRVISCL
ncbi:hypothetical protein Q9233_002591 [Columba guinea]|nr:hypothetical protein Q9233_002591 [Columba guinea]